MKKASVRAPRPDRPQLPHGYIHRGKKGMLSWDDAGRVLSGGRFYWIATTDRDGRPHLVQQWGAWIDGHLYFEGSERTRWARNLARDARIGFGTQSGTRAVMAEGMAGVVRGVERSLAERIARQYATKYGRTFSYRPKPEGYEKGYVFRVRPTKVVVFDLKAFSASATRFVLS
ncbi:MAG: pyridoxamine 5'-phosphate oxidase family protein [Chloroflexota bacterium]|nr:pyridoxamine 5'-phosphate oxidase family protein [Chloroflexota bacterium]MDE3193034.1 pyridoxamine 5'-phosphate oxidase family protein [Chloroflexota bacterium]